MTPIRIMINGLPGNVAANLIDHAEADSRFEVIPFALTGPGISPLSFVPKSGRTISLLPPESRDKEIGEVIARFAPFIAIDYSHPSAVNSNTDFYCRHRIPFVMGTTGGNREAMMESVEDSDIPAIIAPNMAKQIVGFQAMMADAAKNFPGLFSDYTLEIVESHQKGKADTSGTAKAMVTYFNTLGLDFAESDIKMIREPDDQKAFGVPESALSGHAWHTYTLKAKDGTSLFEFKHNINGRDIYARGTLDAVVYLDGKIRAGVKSRVFSMIDMLKSE